MIQENYSLKEAAALAGISKVTLWRLVQRGEVTATLDEKNRYVLSHETLQKWLETLQREHGEPEKRFKNQPETVETTSETAEVVSEMGSETRSRFAEPTETLGETPYETVEMVPAELHRIALESTRHALDSARRAEDRACRMERQMEALSGQLIHYQQALQERAESLVQKEAVAKQAELLAEENAQRISLYEQEKLQWMEELQAAKSRVSWLEKRVPRWVRGIFGAG